MPTHHGVRVHDDQGCTPVPPRVGEQHPKQSISVAELGTFHGALEHRQLLTEYEILERDRSVSTADQREGSEHDDERSQHELSCPAINHRINRARRSDCGEPQYLLDTNIVLHATREGSSFSQAVDAQFQQSASRFRPAICEVSIAELKAFAQAWGERRRERLLEIIDKHTDVEPLDLAVQQVVRAFGRQLAGGYGFEDLDGFRVELPCLRLGHRNMLCLGTQLCQLQQPLGRRSLQIFTKLTLVGIEPRGKLLRGIRKGMSRLKQALNHLAEHTASGECPLPMCICYAQRRDGLGKATKYPFLQLECHRFTKAIRRLIPACVSYVRGDVW